MKFTLVTLAILSGLAQAAPAPAAVLAERQGGGGQWGGGGGWKRDELEERQGGGGQWGGTFTVRIDADIRRRRLEAR